MSGPYVTVVGGGVVDDGLLTFAHCRRRRSQDLVDKPQVAHMRGVDRNAKDGTPEALLEEFDFA